MNLKKLIFNFAEAVYFSRFIRYLWIRLMRLLCVGEYGRLKIFLANSMGVAASKKKVVALNCRSVIFEHIKEIYFRLKGHPFLTVLPIATTKFPPSRYKNKIFSAFQEKYGLVYGENYFSYLWLDKIKPRVYIESYPTVYADFSPSAIKIIYAHGLANLGFSKDFSYIRMIKKYDYVFLTGPLQKRAMLLAQEMYGVALPQMVEIGFLRGDRLLAKKKGFDKRAALRKMGLEDRFTVLFAPTWGEFSGVREWIDVVVELARELDLNILLRLHPLLTGGKTVWETCGINWESRLKELAQKYRRVHIASDDDIDNYLLAADAAVTDASSVGMEFMLLEKPVFFVPAPKFFALYGKERPVAWVREGREVGSRRELKDALRGCLEGTAPIKSYPLENMIYNPGRSLEAIISFLEGLR